MYRVFRAAAAIAAGVAWWGAVFLLCRLATWHFRTPAWWTLPAGLLFGVLWHGLGAILTSLRERGGRGNGDGAPPELAAGMRSAWKSGAPLRRRARARLFGAAPALPWYLAVSRNGGQDGNPLDADGVVSAEAGEGEEFRWRLGRRALWIDLPFALEAAGAERWRAFLGRLRRGRVAAPVGVVVTLDAERLLAGDAACVRDDAVLLRDRLSEALAVIGAHAPVYLLVDRLDVLYGLRSTASRLDCARLERPLGSVNASPGDNASRFVHQCIGRALDDLSPALRSEKGGSVPSAAVQAPMELRRLEKPLASFCARVFDHAGDSRRPYLRGIFLISTGAKGTTLPSLLAELPSFRNAREAAVPAEPWFLTRLLRDDIPSDALPAIGTARNEALSPFVNAGSAGVLAATLVLCWLLTFSFLESKNLLLSAAGKAAAPETAGELAPFFELASLTSLRNKGWRLPRLGMVEADDLEDELRRRYTESYFDLKAIPDIERVQDAAMAAGASADPEFVGNALLMLACTRHGIATTLDAEADGADGAARTGEFLRGLALSLDLATPDDMRRLDAYFAWAGRQDWMPEVRDALAEFEKHIIDKAGGGDLRWLPDWIDRLPGLAPVETARIWAPVAPTGHEPRIAPAWTIDGYRTAETLLAAVAYGSEEDAAVWHEKRKAYLAGHRRRAALEWRRAAVGIWDGFRNRIADAEIPAMLRLAGDGEDPATRFADLVMRNLLPMFEGEADDAEYGLAWLRLRRDLTPPPPDAGEAVSNKLREAALRLADNVRSLGTDEGVSALLSGERRAEPDKTRQSAVDNWNLFRSALRRAAQLAQSPAENLEAVRPHFQDVDAPPVDLPSLDGDVYARAGSASAHVQRYLRERAGGEAWESLSPAAMYDFFRYLATRRAALHLDALWRETVYNPCMLTPGPNLEKVRRLLERNGLLATFLTGAANGFWRWENGRVVNATWGDLNFGLSAEFVDLCNLSAAKPYEPPPRKIELPFLVDSVGVNQEAQEKPVKVEFAFLSGDEASALTYRNYPQRETLVWDRDSGTAARLRIHFPSTIAALEFPGEKGAVQFATLFSGEDCAIGAEAFAQAETLQRIGVKRIYFRARMENSDTLREAVNHVEPTPPASIIRRFPASK